MHRLAAILLVAFAAPAWADASPTSTATVHLGVAACSSPLCHGAVDAGRSSRVLQNEYRTWRNADRHSRAYRVLLGERSRRIAETLGIEHPETDARCLNCHATNVAQDKRGERFQISDGVSCEACHGGAGGGDGREGWIASHTSSTSQRADNVLRGMYPTEDPVKRAELCLSCHLGTDGQFVDHRLMAAGHPRMSFELETFTQLQPAHYRADEDHRARKPAYVASPLKTWAIGQLVTGREFLAAMASPVRSRSGAWPEFTLYDCYSCHQQMRDPAPAQRLVTNDAALPALGTQSLDLTARALRIIDPAAAQSFASQVTQLQREVHRLDYAPTIATLRMQIDAAIDATARWQPARDDAARFLGQIVAIGSDTRTPLTYAQAEQLTMASQAILAGVENPGGRPAKAARVDPGLDRLFAATRSDSSFDSAKFRAALRELAGAPGR